MQWIAFVPANYIGFIGNIRTNYARSSCLSVSLRLSLAFASELTKQNSGAALCIESYLEYLGMLWT